MDKGLLTALAAGGLALFALLLFWGMSRFKRTAPQSDGRKGGDGANAPFVPAILGGSSSSNGGDCGGSDGGGCGGGD